MRHILSLGKATEGMFQESSFYSFVWREVDWARVVSGDFLSAGGTGPLSIVESVVDAGLAEHVATWEEYFDFTFFTGCTLHLWAPLVEFKVNVLLPILQVQCHRFLQASFILRHSWSTIEGVSSALEGLHFELMLLTISLILDDPSFHFLIGILRLFKLVIDLCWRNLLFSKLLLQSIYDLLLLVVGVDLWVYHLFFYYEFILGNREGLIQFTLLLFEVIPFYILICAIALGLLHLHLEIKFEALELGLARLEGVDKLLLFIALLLHLGQSLLHAVYLIVELFKLAVLGFDIVFSLIGTISCSLGCFLWDLKPLKN